MISLEPRIVECVRCKVRGRVKFLVSGEPGGPTIFSAGGGWCAPIVSQDKKGTFFVFACSEPCARLFLEKGAA